MIPIQDIQQTNIQVTEKNGKSRSHEPSTQHHDYRVLTHMKVRQKCLAMAET